MVTVVYLVFDLEFSRCDGGHLDPYTKSSTVVLKYKSCNKRNM